MIIYQEYVVDGSGWRLNGNGWRTELISVNYIFIHVNQINLLFQNFFAPLYFENNR
ncbi:MAG: hypothetical protein LBG80_02170 [Bacteroidales bacterium]|jgi:hypothetical protein|nr:hypothetical protein [Bacteroidales bacterium]